MIQHAFSKLSLVYLISKEANLVFYRSVYKLFQSINCSNYDVIIVFPCLFTVVEDIIQKVQRHHDLIKTHAVR